MTGNEIREKFLRYFESKGHRIVPSSSLVPANDPTLLFTNAGMNQFKDVFLGAEQRDYSRATTSQKCVRAGGKHNDLENVGYTRRHHTFFEMLGNFSFGDYFKKDAIQFAWELVTEVYGLPKDRLYVTVFEDDDEAEELWVKHTDIGRNRIFRCGAKDNFWQMGDTGPCGPCSEIFYDFGPSGLEPYEKDEPFPSDISRYVEIWNLVFMQFDRDKDGNLTPLPRPSIDTGMGLERTAAVLQGKLSNFETDLIRPIIDRAGEMLGVPYDPRLKTSATLRIIADHARATEFLIHDGVVPSNEGRGYVLRKIMRRALRHARLAGREEPFLYELTQFVADLMKPGYPELQDSIERVQRVVREEELRYQRTFATAEREFEAALDKVVDGKIPGSAAFKLYDTFGLSLDEQMEMARERELAIDLEGFETEMQQQRERARASWKGGDAAKVSPIYKEIFEQHPTKFLGYEETEAKGCEVVGLLVGGQPVERVAPGQECEIILDRTPFYAESGGQVGDKGFLLKGAEEVARISDTAAPVKGLNVHKAKALAEITMGDPVDARVDAQLRDSTRRNHTATHLLHAALRQVLGTHVKQAGSVVDPGRLRFDVTHYAAVEPGELEEIERIVNREILVNTPVTTDVMDLNNAVQTGAMALFGEKYGDKVRVVQVGDFSKELCGGTHVGRTGDIGVFKITSEGSVSAGVRRLEAVTGEGAYELYRDALEKVRRIGGLLKAADPEVVDAVERALAERREAEKEIERLKAKLAQSGAGDLTSQAKDVNGVKVIAAVVDGLDRGQLRSLVDSLRGKIGSGVIVLGSAEDGNVSLVCSVTKDLAGKKLHAGKIVGAVAEKVGGRGGGRPDMAEAGGKIAAALPGAIESVYSIVETAG
ncbi:MAG: alanine--tRNA ligase [Bryobacterales bacterium]|nr:alanine--tRNA ligase [Bryobacterales bacterium]